MLTYKHKQTYLLSVIDIVKMSSRPESFQIYLPGLRGIYRFHVGVIINSKLKLSDPFWEGQVISSKLLQSIEHTKASLRKEANQIIIMTHLRHLVENIYPIAPDEIKKPVIRASPPKEWWTSTDDIQLVKAAYEFGLGDSNKYLPKHWKSLEDSKPFPMRYYK